MRWQPPVLATSPSGRVLRDHVDLSRELQGDWREEELEFLSLEWEEFERTLQQLRENASDGLLAGQQLWSLWALRQPALQRLVLLRQGVLLALYGALLIGQTISRKNPDPSQGWRRLVEHGMSLPAWAWGLVGRDPDLDGSEDEEALTIEAHVLAEGRARQQGIDPFDDPDWLNAVVPSFAHAWSSQSILRVYGRREEMHGQDALHVSSERDASRLEEGEIELLLPRGAWPIVHSQGACEDLVELWKLQLRLAVRALREDLA